MPKTLPIFVCVVLMQVCTSFSQETLKYIPDNMEETEGYLKEINNKLLQRIEGENASRVKKIFKKGDERIVRYIKDSAYLFTSQFEQYLDTILNEIYSTNKEIDHSDYRFFVRNSIVPNASCYGNGMFEVYLGLLETMESDDEIAFVLCHEIAHKILDHPLKNATQYVNNLNSTETKQQIKKVRRQEYGRTRAALSIIDELQVDYLNHSKQVEAEADSLGFVFFSNTKYNKANAVSSLQHLNRGDGMLLKFKVKVDSIFNFPQYPFKPFWLKEEVSIFVTEEKIDDYQLSSDTLKTHPEIPYRIDKLVQEFAIDTSSYIPRGQQLVTIEKSIQEESIAIFIDLKQLDFALYQLEKKHDANKLLETFYVEKMMSILTTLCEAREQHELGKYVPQKNNFSDEKELNEIRKFLHALELVEIKMIAQNFLALNKKVLSPEIIGQYQLILE